VNQGINTMHLVTPTGFEPVTCPLEGKYSQILLFNYNNI